MIEENQIPRSQRNAFAKLLGISLRTLQSWRSKAKRPPRRKPGRPPLTAEKCAQALKLVEAEWLRQGTSTGEDLIYHALQSTVSRMLVRKYLKELKLAKRNRHEAYLRAHRHTVQACARDAMWSADATELERAPKNPTDAGKTNDLVHVHGCKESIQKKRKSLSSPRKSPLHNSAIVQADMIRDVATTSVLRARVGPPATAEELIHHFDAAAAERGTYPFVLVVDNGPAQTAQKFKSHLAEKKVIMLFSLPRTPQHNPWAERTNREVKEEAEFYEGDPPVGIHLCTLRVDTAYKRLNNFRLRKSRNYKTATQLDLEMPSASDIVARDLFFSTACAAIAKAVAGCSKVRERRRAEREAIYATLESFGLIKRWRGNRPIHADESASFL